MFKPLKKIPFVDVSIVEQLYKNEVNNWLEKPIYTNSRSSIIISSFVGKTFYIHQGNKYHKLIIVESMLNRRLGEFAFTRKIGRIHLPKSLKRKRK